MDKMCFGFCKIKGAAVRIRIAVQGCRIHMNSIQVIWLSWQSTEYGRNAVAETCGIVGMKFVMATVMVSCIVTVRWDLHAWLDSLLFFRFISSVIHSLCSVNGNWSVDDFMVANHESYLAVTVMVHDLVK